MTTSSPHRCQLKDLIRQRNRTRIELQSLELGLKHRSAAAIQGGARIRRATRRSNVERSIQIISNASPQTLRQWLSDDVAIWFKDPAVASVVYADYRMLTERLGLPVALIESKIKDLALRISAWEKQNATIIQRGGRGMIARSLYRRLRKERTELRQLHDKCATQIQKMYKGHRQRRITRAIKLKRFERQMLKSYQKERTVDKERRERRTMRSKLMQLYVHERREQQSRRVLGDEGDLELSSAGKCLMRIGMAYCNGENAAREPELHSITCRASKKNELVRSYNLKQEEERMTRLKKAVL